MKFFLSELVVTVSAFYFSALQVIAGSSEMGDIHVGRNLLAETTPAQPTDRNTTTPPPLNMTGLTFILYGQCFMLYAYKIELITVTTANNKKETTTITLPAINSDTENKIDVSCGDTNNNTNDATVTFKWTKGLDRPFSNVELVLDFRTSVFGYWSLTSAFLNVGCSSDTSNVTNNCITAKNSSLNFKSLDTPLGYSYHCTDDPDFNIMGDNSTSVKFTRLQVQVGGIKNKKFGYHNDCVGFFSIGIWSIWFVSLILVIILSYAITMNMNIITMDRFDDPKGKPLQVASAPAGH